MKNPILCGWIALACLTGGLQAQEGTPEFDPLGQNPAGPQLLRVQAELVEMPHEAMTKLLREPRLGADDTALRRLVDELIEKGEASVYETMTCMSKSNQKAKSESLEEVIYPTEYEPAELPGTSEAGHTGTSEKKEVKKNWFRTVATAFETRNTGTNLEIEPTLSENGKAVDLRTVIEVVWRTGEDVYTEIKDNFGDASVKVPRFYTGRLTTSTTLETGKPQMVGVISPKGKDGAPDTKRKLMVFVRCEVLTVGR